MTSMLIALKAAPMPAARRCVLPIFALALLLAGPAAALTCAAPEEQAALDAATAEAVVIGRATLVPRPEPEAAPARAPAPPAAPPLSPNAAPNANGMLILTPLAPSWEERRVRIDPIDAVRGDAPAAPFEARFRTGSCVTFAPDGAAQTLFLRHEGEGWRLIGGR
jgi:hypothetical protein